MGLLDNWTDELDDGFPNFDAYSPSAEQTSFMEKSVGNLSTTSSTSSESSKSSDASSTKRSHSVPQPEPITSKSSKNSRKSRPQTSRRHTTPKAGSRPSLASRRPSNFDLFGDDDELQEAEARIGWCELCLKHCTVH